MPAVKVVLFRKGIRELLNSPEIRADLVARAKRVAAQAGDGFEVDSHSGTKRGRASVRTVTFDAMRAEAKSRTLTHALDAAR